MFGVYSGSHLIEQSKGNMIFVSANYRVGVYGWLAGPTIEKEATPNVGLWDQRAALEWIQEYIHLFGGDKDQVSVWGESAGASSILHHLTAFGGQEKKTKPLFRRAVALSPAFQPMGDRRPNGQLEQTFKKFESYAGCAGKGIACLQAAPKTAIDKANQRIQDEAPRGSFAVGVSADGTLSRQLGGVELLARNVVPIESLIISHTSAESVVFVDGSITTDAQLDAFATALYGDLAAKTDLIQKLRALYPPVGRGGGVYANQTARVRDFVRDAAFSCNARYLSQAYPGTKQWYMVYGEAGGWHGGDIAALFMRTNLKVDGRGVPALAPGIGQLSRTYQSYLVSHAVHGDPNTASIKEASASAAVPAVEWKSGPRLVGENVEGVLVVENGTFRMGTDVHVPKKNCDFFQTFMVDVQKAAGLVVGPPGTPVVFGPEQL
jgi:carboxylesterase type B